MTLTGWPVFWLGTMGVALAVMAIIQIAVLIVVLRLVLKAIEATRQVQREMAPLMAKVNKMADDAARTTSIVAAQAERLDQIVGTTVQRVDDTLEVIQSAIIEPIRQGSALLAGIRAAIGVFRTLRPKPKPGREEEDALFIG